MPKAKAVKLSDVTTITTEEQTAEESELADFMDGLGPVGISEVNLYRVLPSGKQRFCTSGPAGQVTERWIQNTYGGGDFLVRAKLNGKWFRSKNVSIEGPPIDTYAPGYLNPKDTDLERLKVDLEAQRLRLQEQQAQMEHERQSREQRNHELQLALIENTRQTASPPVSVTDMITGLKSLKELSSGENEILSNMEKSLGIIERISNIRNNGGDSGGGGWLDWLKPVATEAGKVLIPRLVPFLTPAPGATHPNGNGTPAPAAIAPAPSPAASPEPSPAPAPQPIGDPPPMSPTPEEQYQFNKRQALDFILPIARMGREPGFWAESAIEQVEISNNGVIARFLDEIVKAESFDAWFTDLQTMEPTIITTRPWFELFFQSIRDVLSQKAEDSDKS